MGLGRGGSDDTEKSSSTMVIGQMEFFLSGDGERALHLLKVCQAEVCSVKGAEQFFQRACSLPV